MTLHIFNPEHDMALAAGTPAYTPPASIRAMATQLSWLPRLWAAEGDAVWPDLGGGLPESIEPWGWDAEVKRSLLRAGVNASLLPSDEWLERVRCLSSRRTGVSALREFRHSGLDRLAGESLWCESLEELSSVGYADMVVKAPWSSSGKGVLFVHGSLTAEQEHWCRRVIRQQGGVAVERLCDRRGDMALEYDVSHGHTNFLGLSVFTSSSSGAYAGNMLGSLTEKLSRLGLTEERLSDIVCLHTAFLERIIAPYYEGPLGIDMLVCADGSINPCVEINLRRTMGHVALALERQGARGVFVVTCQKGQWDAKVLP